MMVKRIMGLSGETVELIGAKTFIDGRRIPESYLSEVHSGDKWFGRRHFGPVKIPPERVFLLGDNRGHSFDSRYFKAVPMEMMRGKAVFVVWSREGWRGVGKRL